MTIAATYAVYMVRCSDGTFYTGITTDVERRIHEHNHEEKGAKYTKARRPVTLVYFESVSSRGVALSREHAIRQLTRSQKIALIASHRRRGGTIAL